MQQPSRAHVTYCLWLPKQLSTSWLIISGGSGTFGASTLPEAGCKRDAAHCCVCLHILDESAACSHDLHAASSSECCFVVLHRTYLLPALRLHVPLAAVNAVLLCYTEHTCRRQR